MKIYGKIQGSFIPGYYLFTCFIKNVFCRPVVPEPFFHEMVPHHKLPEMVKRDKLLQPHPRLQKQHKTEVGVFITEPNPL